MTTNPPSWYIPGEGKKPAGPFAAEQIIESWRAGRLNENTLCWQEGMSQWLPLAQVEPFATTIRSAAARPHRGSVLRWLAVRSVVLACLVVAGGILYVYWKESTTIRKARALIAAADYAEASALLGPFLHETYLYGQEALYLSALAMTREYASAANADELAEDALKKPNRQFQDLIQADERWRERAKSDLADIVGSIPKKAPDDLARSVVIAGFLEELKLADTKQLAKELLARLRTWIDKHHSPEDIDAAIVRHILRLDPSQSGDVVALVLPEADEMPVDLRARLALVQRWANDQPPLAKPLASALVERATDLKRAAKNQPAELVLDAAEETCPELREQCARKHLEWVRKDLAEKDYAGVLRGLDGMHTNNYSAAVSAESASLFLEVAQQASKMNPAVAQRAMDTAFQLQPTFGDSEPNVLLWINLHPGPSSEKLQQCQHFLSTFATSEHRNRIQMEIIRDAVGFARSGGAWNAKQYLDAAYTEATSLLEKDPTIKELDPQAWALSQCLADAERYDNAVQIANLFRKAFPETPLKQKIEGMVATWRAVPKSGPRAEAPGGRGRQETLEAKLLRRKRTISTSTAIYDAVANKEIWIVEVADSCTADQFDAEQTRLLRDWVANGGVLWVNGSVLNLFNIRYSSDVFNIFGNMNCAAAGGNHPILEGVKHVRLVDINDKAKNLQYRGVVPLLATREPSGLGNNPVGTTLWSLVPYGKGWISDPKGMAWQEGRGLSSGVPQDDDGRVFWARFCQFCLHELPWPPPASGGSTSGKQPPESSDQGALTGTWQASTGAQFRIEDDDLSQERREPGRRASTGDQFRIEDDGKALTISLITSDAHREFTGKLTRREGKPDAKYLDGSCDAVFPVDSKRYTIRVTGILDDPDHLRLRCSNWPVWNNSGRNTGEKVLNQSLSRSDGTSKRNRSDPFKE